MSNLSDFADLSGFPSHSIRCTCSPYCAQRAASAKKELYLYLISQNTNTDYDTYDAAVVCAESEEAARMTHPNWPFWSGVAEDGHAYWVNARDVQVKFIGKASPDLSPGVICASFNAG